MHFPKLEFKAPLWARSGHTQTILAHLLGKSSSFSYQRTRLTTPDGDFVDVDHNGLPNKKIALILHGLEGSSQRYYVVDLARTLYEHGFGVVALNFRSCSGEINLKPTLYHSGQTEDVSFVIDWIHETWNPEKVFLAGFSMGGNIALKLLGEQGTQAKLTAASTVSTPYNLSVSADYIETGLSKVYKTRFIRMLNDKLSRKRVLFPETPHFTGSSMREFDNQITAPLHGFKDADDYYTKSSCDQYIPAIATPTLIIHSEKDPFCPVFCLPEKAIDQNKSVWSLITQQGGHVGYYGYPSNWVNLQITKFFEQFF